MEGVRHGFGISPCMQELMTYAGHLECYVRSHEIPGQFLSMEVSPSQVYRVKDHVGIIGSGRREDGTYPPSRFSDGRSVC
jgi:hypothetical protein